MKHLNSLLLCIIAVFLLQGCALFGKAKTPLLEKPGQAPGIYHCVQKKESLWKICKAYGVSLQDVAELNNIKNTSQIKVGDKIFIPGAGKALSLSPVESAADKSPPEKIISKPGLFIWPVRGKVIQEYGIYGGIKYDGINIKAAAGTPVKAAKEGTVAFAGVLEGYGNTIIIEHKENYATVYANNKANLVKQGQNVTKGQQIAEVGGSTEPKSSTYLHFQIRCDNKPRNPFFYLPKA
jgi:murein DD-endopeptidase MepM/ murein hydrolase activator NlpD